MGYYAINVDKLLKSKYHGRYLMQGREDSDMGFMSKPEVSLLALFDTVLYYNASDLIVHDVFSRGFKFGMDISGDRLMYYKDELLWEGVEHLRVCWEIFFDRYHMFVFAVEGVSPYWVFTDIVTKELVGCHHAGKLSKNTGDVAGFMLRYQMWNYDGVVDLI